MRSCRHLALFRVLVFVLVGFGVLGAGCGGSDETSSTDVSTSTDPSTSTRATTVVTTAATAPSKALGAVVCTSEDDWSIVPIDGGELESLPVTARCNRRFVTGQIRQNDPPIAGLLQLLPDLKYVGQWSQTTEEFNAYGSNESIEQHAGYRDAADGRAECALLAEEFLTIDGETPRPCPDPESRSETPG